MRCLFFRRSIDKGMIDDNPGLRSNTSCLSQRYSRSKIQNFAFKTANVIRRQSNAVGNKKKHVGKKLKCFLCMSISGEKRLMECVSKVGVQYTVKPTFYKYSRSPTNSHFSETASFFDGQSIH